MKGADYDAHLNQEYILACSVLSVGATPATASRSFSPGAATTSSLATTESVFPWITGGSHNWTFVALLLLRCDNIFHCRDGSDETKCSLLRKVLMSIMIHTLNHLDYGQLKMNEELA